MHHPQGHGGPERGLGVNLKALGGPQEGAAVESVSLGKGSKKGALWRGGEAEKGLEVATGMDSAILPLSAICSLPCLSEP